MNIEWKWAKYFEVLNKTEINQKKKQKKKKIHNRAKHAQMFRL